MLPKARARLGQSPTWSRSNIDSRRLAWLASLPAGMYSTGKDAILFFFFFLSYQ